MKTLKFILPVVAIMAAVAGVFATSSAPVVTLVDVTALSATPCTKDGQCDTDVTTKKCQLASGTQFRQRISAASCSSVISVGAFVADQPNNP